MWTKAMLRIMKVEEEDEDEEKKLKENMKIKQL